MKVLVTGGTGLVGVHAINQILQQGRAVRALVRDTGKLARCLQPFGWSLDQLEVVEGDITEREDVERALRGCNALMHCAGVFSDKLSDEARLQKTNIVGSENVLGQAVGAGLDPIIHISSYLALFPPPGKLHTAQDPVTQPSSMYARTKAAAERYAREQQSRGAPVVTVYPGSIQGPHDPTYGIGSQLIEKAIRSGMVLETGNGRVYTDVRDLARLLVCLLEPGRGPRRYMFGGYFLTDEEVRQILSQISGKTLASQKIPSVVLRVLGRLFDMITRLTGREFQLTHEGAQVLTRSVPCDDGPAIQEFKLEMVGAETSFRDLVEWMVSEGKLPQDTLGTTHRSS